MAVNLDVLLERGQMALEDGDFSAAEQFFEAALNQDPHLGKAWWGKFLAKNQCANGNRLVSLRLEKAEHCKAIKETAQLSQRKETIPNYFDMSDFDRHYEASAPARQEQLRKESDFWSSGSVGRMMDYCGDQSEAAKAKEAVLAQMELRVRQAAEADQAICRRLQAEFTALEESRHREALQLQRSDYLFCQDAVASGKRPALKKAVALLSKLESYEDCPTLLEQARNQLNTLQKRRHRGKILLVSAIALAAAAVLLITWLVPAVRYSDAEALLESGCYLEAADAFEALGDHADAKSRVLECKYAYAAALLADGDYQAAAEAFAALNDYADAPQQAALCTQKYDEQQQALQQQEAYAAAEALEQQGRLGEAAIAFYKLGDRTRSFALWDQVAVRETISAGTFHTVGLKTDGTVVAVGDNFSGECQTAAWRDIIAISAGGNHTVGLKRDGTVVAVGRNKEGQCQVSGWRDIVAISAGYDHTVGLKADGTVVAVGADNCDQCKVSDWGSVVAISASDGATLGLKANTTVLFSGTGQGNNEISGYSGFVAICAGGWAAAGLRPDGTVFVATEGWFSEETNICSISLGSSHAIALKTDGTVIAAGGDYIGECQVSAWQDIVAISAGDYHSVGLKRDGTVVATGQNRDGQCDVGFWQDIQLPNLS